MTDDTDPTMNSPLEVLMLKIVRVRGTVIERLSGKYGLCVTSRFFECRNSGVNLLARICKGE